MYKTFFGREVVVTVPVNLPFSGHSKFLLRHVRTLHDCSLLISSLRTAYKQNLHNSNDNTQGNNNVQCQCSHEHN